MSTNAEPIDQELVTEIRSMLAEEVTQRFTSFKSEVERRMKELSARPPSVLTGISGAPATRSLPLLGGDQKFRDWLRGPRGKSSAYAASFESFHIETKASPLLNTGGTVHVPQDVAAAPPTALRLVELLPVVPMSLGAAAEYSREAAFTPAAGIVAEGAVKPTTVVAYANVLASIKTIATVTKASLQSLADTPGLGDWLDARLRYAVQLKAEDYLLNAAAPDGLLASAGTIDAAFTPPTGATALDAIGAAISQLSAAGFTPDGVVMSGSDVAKMRTLKNTTEDYLWARPSSPIAAASVWGVPLVISPSMAAGTWLVGAFAQSCLLFVRQLLTVEVAYENEDDFTKNLCTLRAEERIGSAIPIPAGLLTGTFVPPVTQTASTKK